MFVSRLLLERSAHALKDIHPFYGFAYLAFKKARLPVEDLVSVNFTAVMDAHLDRHFKPLPGVTGFYSPFFTSRPALRWLVPRYASTSLQRIVVDTFSECFHHEKGSSIWSWRSDYVDSLERKLAGKKIPSVLLAAWLYRDEDLGDATAGTLTSLLRRDFYLDLMDWKHLFDDSYELNSSTLFSSHPLSLDDIESVIGSPPGQEVKRGASLKSLEIKDVGPVRKLLYQPADRINIVTGDNSVGKTFLLDAVWWGLTGSWAGDALLPSLANGRNNSTIQATLSVSTRQMKTRNGSFDWPSRKWRESGTKDSPGLAVYARHDGSMQVFDPMISQDPGDILRRIRLSPEEVKNGKYDTSLRLSVCNGLLRDWISWQLQPSRYRDQWEAFRTALSGLSPQDLSLEAGDPVKMPPNEQEIPTIRMPYGDTPLFHSSAAVTRIMSLAYILVWAWFRHAEAARLLGKEPTSRVALLVDELEAHLHPKWQRTVLPSLARTVKQLSPYAAVQMHFATHSPLVLASAEQIFDESMDSLFTLDFDGLSVVINEREFVRQGRVDRWLTSDIFGLGESRSLDGERAIEKAHKVMLSEITEECFVKDVHLSLLKSLAQDDDFWVRWIPYAIRYGAMDDSSNSKDNA